MDAIVEAEFQILRLQLHEGSHQEGNGTDIVRRPLLLYVFGKHGSGFFRMKLERSGSRRLRFPVGRDVDAFRRGRGRPSSAMQKPPRSRAPHCRDALPSPR